MISEEQYLGRGRRPASLGPQTHKRCSRCGVMKSIEAYALRKVGSPLVQSACMECSKAVGKAWYEANRTRAAENSRAWGKANREKLRVLARKLYYRDIAKSRQIKRERYAKNVEKNKERRRAYYRKNIEVVRQRYKEWSAKNKHKKCANSIAYEARKINATPSWANKTLIDAVYQQAAELTRSTGIPHHVDHVIPLKSNKVCGLHVHSNLQVITASENRSKSNRVWPGKP